ncbi:MAG: protein phosphatase 2C domain-containing protein [Chlamydiales bacterium]|jgi:protein phosphatase|nr:protein phosphatase 2C domain-containing protein [Chlamydiales bacterium]
MICTKKERGDREKMATTRRDVQSFGISDIGLLRTNNEDAWKEIPEKHFYALADGMGGHNAGEVASYTAIESVCSSIQELPSVESIQDLLKHMKKAVFQANKTVLQKAKQAKEYKGMGTTLCCFMLFNDYLVYAHVGDSRLYRIRTRIEQLTKDHKIRHVQWGRPSDRSKPTRPLLFRNVITRAIGTHVEVEPDIGSDSVQPGDLYLLCSDGLSNLVNNEAMHSILKLPCSLEIKGNQLLQKALKNGGHDNITLLLVNIL